MERRKFLTFLTGMLTGIGSVIASIPFFKSMSKPSHVKHPLHDHRVEFPKLQPGQMMSVATAGDLVYVARRTADQIESLRLQNVKLKDPGSLESVQPENAKNNYRSLNPEYFIAYGRCTHLGCSTSHVSSDTVHPSLKESLPNGGYYCPCHGAVYDSAGRVHHNMPAEKNLEIPEYEFLDETTIRIIVRD